jgi:ATP-dependent RNA helicase DDX24/MAK5
MDSDVSSDEEGEGEDDKNDKIHKKILKKKQVEAEKKAKFEAQLKRSGIQTIVVSATLMVQNKKLREIKGDKDKKSKPLPFHQANKEASVVEKMQQMLKFKQKKPVIIDLTAEDAERMPSTLTEKVVQCKKDEKDVYMYYYLKANKGGSCIIFSNSITCTKRVASILDMLKVENYVLHSKMQQRQRLKNLDRFKSSVQNGKGAVLVCTDVAARGLDIPSVSNILHYQTAMESDIYVHRCGRTARIGRSGEALSLMSPDDEKNFKKICKALKKDTDKIEMLQVNYAEL